MGTNELLRLELGYSANANNGNIASQRMTFPAIDSAAALDVTQTYHYDPLNRIKRIEEGSQSRDFQYDPFGKMWVANASSGFARDSFTPATSAWFDANNRLTNPALGVQHDAAGNLTAIGAFEYEYDAEGMMTRATPSIGSATTYRYDGEGRRVQKQTGTGPVTTFVYSAFGELAAEYTSDGVPEGQPTGTHYLMADHLGSTRLVMGPSGNIISRHDYLPFGEEIGADGTTRTTAMKYDMNDDLTQRFTGKERDGETGLDYFGARHMSSVQGRWTSADALNVTRARMLTPANTLNKYVYAANNPLKFVDRDGYDITIYYRESQGLLSSDFGHIFIGALNQDTGQVRFLDFYPQAGQWPRGEINANMTLDRLREHASITIQTTPEAAQKVIEAIDKLIADVPDYDLSARLDRLEITGTTCTTLCQTVLEEIGIGLDAGYLPFNVWNAAYRKYSPQFRYFGQWNPGTHSWGPTAIQYQAGRDFGNPRFSGIDYNWLMWSLYSNSNSSPPKGCVEVSDSATGTKSKTCD